MTKKELRELRHLDCLINSKQKRLDELKRTAQTSQDFIQIEKMDAEITEDIDRLADMKRALGEKQE